MIVKAHVSPAFRAKTRPHTEQRSKKDHPENRRPSPQCGQRLRRPRPSAVAMNFQPPGAKRKSATNREDNGFVSGPDAQLFAATFFYSTTDFGHPSIEPTSVSSHFVRLNLCSLAMAMNSQRCPSCRSPKVVPAVETGEFIYFRCSNCVDVWSIPERRDTLRAMTEPASEHDRADRRRLRYAVH